MLQFYAQRKLSLARSELAASSGSFADALRICIIPPAAPGSLGDAAMISATASYWKDKGAETVALLHGSPWPLDAAIDHRLDSDQYFYEGNHDQHRRILQALKLYSHLFMIGADIIDGAYNPQSARRRISLVHDFVAAGRQGRILAASYNETPEATTRNALAALPVGSIVCARDPYSFRRLGAVSSVSPRQAADLAFLLKPRHDEKDARRAKDWIEQQKRSGRRVVGLNINYLQVEKLPHLPAAFCIVTQRLLGAGLSVLLVPHDTRTSAPDAAQLRKIVDNVPDDQREYLHMVETVSPGAMKAALSQVDLLISGRLHAMVLAMGSGVPAIGLAYQDKFEGVMEQFGFEASELLADPATVVVEPALFAERILHTLSSVGRLRQRIATRLPQVIALAENNFA